MIKQTPNSYKVNIAEGLVWSFSEPWQQPKKERIKLLYQYFSSLPSKKDYLLMGHSHP
jgi:hypothetical protein